MGNLPWKVLEKMKTDSEIQKRVDLYRNRQHQPQRTAWIANHAHRQLRRGASVFGVERSGGNADLANPSPKPPTSQPTPFVFPPDRFRWTATWCSPEVRAGTPAYL